jgi:hypothetical protein
MTASLRCSDILPLLIAACPSIEPAWREYAAWQNDRELVTVDLGEFARHLTALAGVGQTDELPGVLVAVERLLAEGDADAQNAVVTGLLEALPFDHSDGYADADRAFAVYFGPETRAAWRALGALYE